MIGFRDVRSAFAKSVYALCGRLVAGTTIDTHSLKIYAPHPLVNHMLRGMLWSGRYERQQSALAERWIRPVDAVVEFGAGIGFVSAIVNRRLKDKTRHIAIEVNKQLIPILETNQEQNGCKFEICHAAIVAQESTHAKHAVMEFGTNFTMTKLKIVQSEVVSRKSEDQIPILSINDLKSQMHFAPTALIMDIEGYEYELLPACFSEWPSLERGIVEFHNASGQPIEERVKNVCAVCGLSVVDKSGKTYVLQRR